VKSKIFAAVAVAIGALAAGCTSSSGGSGAPAAQAAPMPSADSFTAGSCRSAAEHVIALGEIAGRLQGRTDIPMADRNAMEAHQEALRGMLTKVSDTSVRSPLQQLVVTVGWTRLRLDTQSYDTTLLDAVARADADTRAVCVK
jgi:hypothetical protein